MSYIYELLEQVSNLIKTPATKKFFLSKLSLLQWLTKEDYHLYTAQQLANLWDNLEVFSGTLELCHLTQIINDTNKDLTFQQWLAMQDFVNQDIDTILNNWNTYQEN